MREAEATSERPAVELPTLAVAAAVYGGWLLLTWHYHAMPTALFVALAAVLGCWQGSLQHEVLHGHPTRSRWVNETIGYPPIALWLPYPIYRDSHITHHRVDTLTCPLTDPESYYLPADDWAALSGSWWGRLWQKVLIANNTALGRLTIGPAIGLARFYPSELKLLARGDRGTLVTWAVHAGLLVPVLWWVMVVCAIPFWPYAFGIAYGGLALTMIRSFYEHRPADMPGHRTAINEASWPMRLLFLNNSYHALHHERPGVAWYDLPELYGRERARLLAENGGFLHPGYWSIYRRFGLRPKDIPVHPAVRRQPV
ncbi:MAG: fatty acid desaturase [Alphaproteobacteria bacterium]|nr:fatty acid desaturase [Alphaproteobacteria bacterium]